MFFKAEMKKELTLVDIQPHCKGCVLWPGHTAQKVQRERGSQLLRLDKVNQKKAKVSDVLPILASGLNSYTGHSGRPQPGERKGDCELSGSQLWLQQGKEQRRKARPCPLPPVPG